MSPLEPILRPISRTKLKELAETGFGDMIIAVQWLLDDGSRHEDLWGINLYPAESSDDWIEFDSMINVRPTQGNPFRGVESEATQQIIRSIVQELIQP